jgi:hypothetical protein
MGMFGKGSAADRPIEVEFPWDPGRKHKLMSYSEATKCLKSGDPRRMAEAIGSNILNAPKLYNDVSNSLGSSHGESLVQLLVPLLQHDAYEVRCSIPPILGQIGDASLIPQLESVVARDKDQQVVKNARLAIEKIGSR